MFVILRFPYLRRWSGVEGTLLKSEKTSNMPPGRPRADRQLQACREEGLTCRECIHHSAQQLALISDGLPAARIRQMFNALYPAPNCLPMAGMFVQIVVEKQGGTVAPRKGPGLAAPIRFTTAVA